MTRSPSPQSEPSVREHRFWLPTPQPLASGPQHTHYQGTLATLRLAAELINAAASRLPDGSRCRDRPKTAAN